MSGAIPGKNRRVALTASLGACAMLGMAYAAVPLYAFICQVTGIGGTTQRAGAAPAVVSEKQITIRFDANADAELGWHFKPVQAALKVKLGEQALAHYEAINQSSRTVAGTAVFNVTPPEAGVFFNKIQCFCFTEQTLKPGERVDLPVVFFVDPDIANDADTRSITEITLSYTFYPSKNPGAKTAALKTN